MVWVYPTKYVFVSKIKYTNKFSSTYIQWSGKYEIDSNNKEKIKVEVDVTDLSKGTHLLRKGQKAVQIEIVNDGGISNVQYKKKWSKDNPGKMTIYTAFDNKTVRTSEEFGYTAAHEFGHLLGIGDAYPDKVQPNKSKGNDMMWWNNGVIPVVSNLDLMMVLNAFSQNKFQEFEVIKKVGK